MTEREFASCIALLCASVGREMSAEQLRAWYGMLGDLSVEQLKAGIVATLRTYTFAGFPPIGTIRQNSGVTSGRIDANDRLLLAWQAVRAAISKVGAHDSPDFDDRAINATIRELGGWPLLCYTPSEEMQWLEKRFVAIYRAMCSVNLPDDLTQRLAGITEIGNVRNGHPSAPIPVAQVRCLTSPNVAAEPITRRIEQREVPKLSGPQIASAKLAERLTFDDREPEPPAVAPKTKEQHLKDLKLWTINRAGSAIFAKG